ncbi:streptomycin 6-kinase [Paenibacillus turicensis]|uniref:Streptomycin 6-kinase n=1 Tax=Paenibacillus turicensis TaxID=160487 RepID=A0ABS4FTA0_9BACL|nr:aminoglycoside phosphotransferase family protein [Paenibacillus turicensis]MBP1905784.1 streptomycin 6-kinase [Paenibacillus turicensis]
MKHFYGMSELEVGEIVKQFGQAHYDKVIGNLEKYEAKWNLTNIQLKSNLSANLIFTCHSDQFGDTVLKIGYPDSPEIVTEVNALKEYDGGKFCKVYKVDIEAGIFLEQHIVPGIALRAEPSLDARLSVFSELYQDLHISSNKAEAYPTYKQWVYRITDYMSIRQDCTELYMKMKKAKAIFDSISLDYNKKLLLHGDFHHDNILQNRNGGYTIIDPKGVIGDPVFDTPRFILNEFNENDEVTPTLQSKVSYIITTLAKRLHIPSHILKQCLYVEMTMAVCWCAESGSDPMELARLMEKIELTEQIMDSQEQSIDQK